ncbi:hypothetical protein ACFFQF_25400 [Haladaptatus pallidirubidus]|uniref:hypothetical protein n=1 Tax=Haladaptatus pallidirubidus TaxID=1008152 RepID=UPI001D0F7A48|nr:hypothetical protein [Haladaptatus pallidirubidus]
MSVGQLLAWSVERSPIHYKKGDMRRDYGWTSALLRTVCSVSAVGLGVRAILTALFVAFVTADIALVVLFNLCLTAFVGRLLLSSVKIHPRDRRQRRIRNGWTRAVRTDTHQRRSRDSQRGIDRL